jgi:hypothetical protein
VFLLLQADDEAKRVVIVAEEPAPPRGYRCAPKMHQ